MDTTSHRNWNIYVFPNNFLLDKSGRIRNVAVGTLKRDKPEILNIVNRLVAEQDF